MADPRPDAHRQVVGGRIWRYELEPVDGGTRVRESWDISQESAATRPIVRKGAAKTRKDMAATLERIDEARHRLNRVTPGHVRQRVQQREDLVAVEVELRRPDAVDGEQLGQRRRPARSRSPGATALDATT